MHGWLIDRGTRVQVGSPIATEKIDLFVYSSPERKEMIRQYAGALLLDSNAHLIHHLNWS